jgi:uncharacterized membrane protein
MHSVKSWSLSGQHLLNRTPIGSHPRLIVSTAAAILLYFLLWDRAARATRFLIAADCGILLFLASVWLMMARATPEGMRQRAAREDESRYAVLFGSVTAAIAILFTIVFELHDLKALSAAREGLNVTLAVATIVLSWFFMNTTFALHYAHGYYGDADPSSNYKPSGGLIFPGRREPDYWDFLYFSFVLGMTFQVSDVQIEEHTLRREALAHGVLAFFFNVAVLALTINIIAGLV